MSFLPDTKYLSPHSLPPLRQRQRAEAFIFWREIPIYILWACVSSHVKDMSASVQMQFSRNRSGRTMLHLVCLIRDHKVKWHLKGVWREIFGNLWVRKGNTCSPWRNHSAPGVAYRHYTKPLPINLLRAISPITSLESPVPPMESDRDTSGSPLEGTACRSSRETF